MWTPVGVPERHKISEGNLGVKKGYAGGVFTAYLDMKCDYLCGPTTEKCAGQQEPPDQERIPVWNRPMRSFCGMVLFMWYTWPEVFLPTKLYLTKNICVTGGTKETPDTGFVSGAQNQTSTR